MTFRRQWVVVSTDPDLTESDFRSWVSAAQIPSIWSFDFTKTMPSSLQYYPFGPLPGSPGIVLLCNRQDPRWTAIIPAGYAAEQSCVVTYMPGESGIELGARLLHEMLHAQDIDSDTMTSSERGGFCEYLKRINSPFVDFCSNPLNYQMGYNHSAILSVFYDYLIKKNLPDYAPVKPISFEAPAIPPNPSNSGQPQPAPATPPVTTVQTPTATTPVTTVQTPTATTPVVIVSPQVANPAQITITWESGDRGSVGSCMYRFMISAKNAGLSYQQALNAWAAAQEGKCSY